MIYLTVLAKYNASVKIYKKFPFLDTVLVMMV